MSDSQAIKARFRDEIERRKTKADDLRREADEIESSIRGLLDAVNIIDGVQQEIPDLDRSLSRATILSAAETVLRESPKPLKAPQIVERCKALGKDVPYNSLRGVLSGQQGKRIFKSVRRGLWTLIDKES